jgi:Peptidase family C25
MPDSDSPPAMPIPLGVLETGGFADSLDPAAIQQLKAQGAGGSVPGGSVPQDIVKAKGQSDAAHFGMVGGELNADNLEKAGWAVIFGASVDQKIRTNLSPLIDRRKGQVGDDTLFKILDPPAHGQSAADWLLTQHTSLNVVDPSKGVPYYVMIVASPEEISFEFQFELDLYWGVGRLWLENPADFECYAQSVVAYETQSKVPSSRKMVLFAPDYNGKDNGATKLMTGNLVNPLIQTPVGQAERFKLQSFLGATATKSNLNDIFAGADPDGPPALLFTGSHGLLKLPTSKELADAMGAIVCQDWKGDPNPPLDDSYYAAWDLPKNAKVHGMVHFLFDCYGLGWPKNDTYSSQRKEISPTPMMARLPQALLGRENGALAILGHIDRAWSYSYEAGGQPQDQSFRDVLTKLMNGYRFGSATDQFNFRWAALSIPLADTLQKMQTRRGLDQQAAQQWVARDDARNYILHGDPAIKLRVDKNEMPPLAS